MAELDANIRRMRGGRDAKWSVKAHWQGICRYCGDDILPNQDVTRHDELGWVHTGCFHDDP